MGNEALINRSCRWPLKFHHGVFVYYLFSDIKEMAERTGMFVGLNKGFIVSKPAVVDDAHRFAKSQRKGRAPPRAVAIRQVVAEICGMTPFERKMMELIKTGQVSKEKRANAKKAQIESFIKAQKSARN